MILGVGTDLVDIGRIRMALGRWGERFAERVLVDPELERFRAHRKPESYLAKRFAAKEAFAKAMGTGIRYPVTWQNVSVANHPSGRPYLVFSAPLAALLEERGVRRVHLALSDEVTVAAAFVVLEGAVQNG